MQLNNKKTIPITFEKFVNLLNQHYVTNSNIWTVDETKKGPDHHVFLVINIKTKGILGYIIDYENVASETIIEFDENRLTPFP
jgi:hypothetical protein